MIKEFIWAKIDLETTVNEFIPAKSKAEGQPRFLIIAGATAVGKTLLRRQKFGNTYVTLDAGDIFLSLTCNRNLRFPSSALDFEVNCVGYNILMRAFSEKRNIICELSLIPYEEYRGYLGLVKELGFLVEIEWLDCDLDTAQERNANRENEFISSYYTDPYHLHWIAAVHDQVLN
jgi:predicted kinase